MFPVEAWLAEAEQHRLRTGKPLVTLSYAQSLDGSITLKQGAPAAISGPESMRMVHQLRAAHGAILVGIGTVLADNPRLNVRLVTGRNPQPVVLDSQLRIPLQANLVASPAVPLWLAAAPGADPQKKIALESNGVLILPIPLDPEGNLNLGLLLEKLAEKGINSLLVEGGARVITGFLKSGLADQAVLTVAPLFLGGYPAVGSLQVEHPETPSNLDGFPHLVDPGMGMYGSDIIIWGKIGRR